MTFPTGENIHWVSALSLTHTYCRIQMLGHFELKYNTIVLLLLNCIKRPTSSRSLTRYHALCSRKSFCDSHILLYCLANFLFSSVTFFPDTPFLGPFLNFMSVADWYSANLEGGTSIWARTWSLVGTYCDDYIISDYRLSTYIYLKLNPTCTFFT